MRGGKLMINEGKKGSNNVRMKMTVEGFKWQEVRQTLDGIAKVVTGRYFPFSILWQSNQNSVGTLKMSGTREDFLILENLFGCITFEEDRKLRIDTTRVKVVKAKEFLKEIARYYSGKDSPFSTPIAREKGIILIDGVDEVYWSKVVAFIRGTTLEEISMIGTETENKIIAEV
jgi:hypothetical protein